MSDLITRAAGLLLASLIVAACAGGGPPLPQSPPEGLFDIPPLTAVPLPQEARFYSLDGAGGISLFSDQSWGRNWHSIVPLTLGGRKWSSLLFYDRVEGTATLFHTTGDGALSTVKTYSGWRKTWDFVLPIVYGLGQGLLFYDREAGLARVYAIGPSGDLSRRVDTTIGSQFDLLATGRFRSTWARDLFAYTRQGYYRVWSLEGITGSLTERASGDVGLEWDFVVAGDFSGSQLDDVLLWDRDAARTLVIDMETGAPGTESVGWMSTEHVVLAAGSFGGGEHDDLLVYDRKRGEGAFYFSDGSSAPFGAPAAATPARLHKGWRRTWSDIVPGRFSCGFSPGCRDDLLFYDNHYLIRILPLVVNDLTIPLPDVNAQVATRWLPQLNSVYGTAGLRFTAAPAQYVYDSKLKPGCDEKEAVKQTADKEAVKGSRRSQLVIFLYGKDKSGSDCSASEREWVKVQNMDADATSVAHETGHFLGLRHVFRGATHTSLRAAWIARGCTPTSHSHAVELLTQTLSPDVTLKNLDADDERPQPLKVLDTPGNPGPYFWALAGLDRCDTNVPIPISLWPPTASKRVNPERHNVMDYEINGDWPECPGVPAMDLRCGGQTGNAPGFYTISPDQARAVRAHLRTGAGKQAPRARLISP